GWPVGTVSVRLARGRERLRQRLLRRGVTLSGGALAALGLEGLASAAVPRSAAVATAQAAVALASQPPSAAGPVSESVLELVRESCESAALAGTKKVLAALLLAIVFAAVAMGVI